MARTLDVELVGLVEVLPGREQLLLRAGVGWTGGEVGEGTAMAGPGSLIHYTIVSGEPVVSEDLAADDRFEIAPLLDATVDFHERPQDLVGERAARQVLGVGWRGEARLHSDAGV